METYLEGMDAALNKVSVAWEKIVTNLTDNDFIISIIDQIANFLDGLAAALSNTYVLVNLIVAVSAVALISLNKK